MTSMTTTTTTRSKKVCMKTVARTFWKASYNIWNRNRTIRWNKW